MLSDKFTHMSCRMEIYFDPEFETQTMARMVPWKLTGLAHFSILRETKFRIDCPSSSLVFHRMLSAFITTVFNFCVVAL